MEPGISESGSSVRTASSFYQQPPNNKTTSDSPNYPYPSRGTTRGPLLEDGVDRRQVGSADQFQRQGNDRRGKGPINIAQERSSVGLDNLNSNSDTNSFSDIRSKPVGEDLHRVGHGSNISNHPSHFNPNSTSNSDYIPSTTHTSNHQALQTIGTPYQAFSGDFDLDFLLLGGTVDQGIGGEGGESGGGIGAGEYDLGFDFGEIGERGKGINGSEGYEIQQGGRKEEEGSSSGIGTGAGPVQEYQASSRRTGRLVIDVTSSTLRSLSPDTPIDLTDITHPPSQSTSQSESRNPPSSSTSNQEPHQQDQGSYQPGDIQVEPPLPRRSPNSQPEISLDSFRWAIRNSLASSSSRGLFADGEVYIPPKKKDLPDWHSNTDWEFGIGTFVDPKEGEGSSSNQEMVQNQSVRHQQQHQPSQKEQEVQRSGMEIDMADTPNFPLPVSSPPSRNHPGGQPFPRPHPSISTSSHSFHPNSQHQSHLQSQAQSPSQILSPPQIPSPISQSQPRSSMLIPALQPGMHRPLPSPNSPGQIRPFENIAGYGNGNGGGMHRSSSGDNHMGMNSGAYITAPGGGYSGQPIGYLVSPVQNHHQQSQQHHQPQGPSRQHHSKQYQQHAHGQQHHHHSFPGHMDDPNGPRTTNVASANPARNESRVTGTSSGKVEKRKARVVDTGEGSPGSQGGHGEDELGNEEQAKKRKKPRVALSCAQCTKRKQKCNRQIPCQHCIQRRIPEQCVIYKPGEPFPDMPKPPRPPSKRRKADTPKETGRTKLPAIVADTGAESATSTFGAWGDTAKVAGVSAGQIAPNTPATPVSVTSARRRFSSVAVSDSIQSPGMRSQIEQQDQEDEEDEDEDMNKSVESEQDELESTSGFSDAVLKRIAKLEDTVFHQREKARQSAASNHLRTESGLRRVSADRATLQAEERDSRTLSKQSSSDEAGTDTGEQTAPPAGEYSRSTSAGDASSIQPEKWYVTDGTVPSIEAHRASKATIKLDLSDCGTPAENLARLIKDCGVSPLKLMELVAELPQYNYALALIDLFFTYINHIRYTIDEAGFRAAFEDIYKKKDEGGPEPGNVRSLPLIFIVLATSVMGAPEHLAGDERNRKLTSLRMYWSSRRSILIATSIQPESLELVVTRLLSAMYLILIHDRRLTESWSQLGASLRTAQAIGCHRDGSKLGLDPIQTEYRRRVWSYLYHADRHYSLILGRPPSIIDAYCDAREPSNIEFSELRLDRPAVSKPLSEPTSATYLILRKRFSTITGKITHHFQKLNEPATYADVQQLDDEILNYVDELPPHYRMIDPDTSLDEEQDYIIIHRYIICTEVLFMRIILHRPWLLRKLKHDKYALSRRACFEAAKMDFRLRQSFHKNYKKPVGIYYTGQFREFNSAMIAGISAIIFPRSEDAEEMRLILATFLDKHPIDKQQKKDATSRKEVAIVYTLYRRALQVLERDDVIDGDHPNESAALLLGLRDGDSNQSQINPIPGPRDDVTDFAQPAFGAEGSAAIEFKKFYSTMVDRGIVNTNSASDSAGSNPLRFSRPDAPRPTAIGPLHQPLNILKGSDGPSIQSPTSIHSMEDERPQKLLDTWLSLNNTMVIAGSGGQDIPPGLGISGGMFDMDINGQYSGGMGAGMGMGIDMGTGGGFMLNGGETSGWPNPFDRYDAQSFDSTAYQNNNLSGTISGSAGLNLPAQQYNGNRSQSQGVRQDSFYGLTDRMAQSSASASRSQGQDQSGLLPPSSNAVNPTEGLGSVYGTPLEDTELYWNHLIDGMLINTGVE